MKKQLSVLAIASLFSLATQADMLGVYAGYGHWKPDFKGTIANGSTQSLDFDSNINVDDDNQSTLYIAFEHPIPVIPNIRVADQDMSSSGSGTFTGTFGGQAFAGDVDTDFDLSHRDYTLYYEILDNWVNLDLGLTGRKFDGYVRVTDANNAANEAYETFNETLPMLYGKARFDLPLTGLSLSATLNYISHSGNTVTDTAFVLGYETSFGLGIEGGVRNFSLELDDEDDFTSDLEFDGVFVNATYHF
ncbi:TIGR04219 family outer membrane beta-barrel protein [Pleionea litopenaei]|uniref:TIGR04219 family outer membrane beta-barrel protein n=1 Tax=Pleionea litopenaei TaxID=3070815 RepID=A0AA51RSP5_9GAMM|nr:TIGR04219 family outer membrane beta-barrel protein [Pleionea sp. HL-JVS1]WMS86937.1 TIGR04219 family outer membrane beta-barrel protein [Pleionea sp. HL-JVS1]